MIIYWLTKLNYSGIPGHKKNQIKLSLFNFFLYWLIHTHTHTDHTKKWYMNGIMIIDLIDTIDGSENNWNFSASHSQWYNSTTEWIKLKFHSSMINTNKIGRQINGSNWTLFIDHQRRRWSI